MAHSGTQQIPRKYKFEALDGLRGLSALVVVTFHYLFEAGADKFAGYIVVDFFLMLSGFVLSHAYFSRPLNFGKFVRNRIARMWPTHALIIIIMAIALVVFRGEFELHKLLMKLTFTNNLGMGPDWPIYNFASWTVAVEFWVNMVACFLFISMPILRHSLFALSVVCGVIAAACYTTLYIYPGHLDAVLYDFGPGLNSGFIRCLAGFCLGLVVHRIFVLYGEKLKSLLGIWSGLLISAVFIGMLLNPVEETRWDFFAIIVLPVVVFYYAAMDNWLTRIPASLTFLGKISFSLYLLHWPVVDAMYLFSEFLGIEMSLENVTNLLLGNLLAFTVSFVGAIFLQKYFEYPLYLRFREAHGGGSKQSDRIASKEDAKTISPTS